MEREYYTLEQAANIRGCTYDDIIHYGATEKLKICVLAGSGCMYLKEVMRKGTGEIINRDFGYVGSRFAALSPRCLQDFEAGHKDVEALTGIWFGKPEQDIEMLKVLDMDVEPPEMKAKLLKNCKLVVTKDDFERFMGGSLKKRKKIIRFREELTELIHDLCEANQVNFMHQMSGLKAWSKLVSVEFTSDFLKQTTSGELIFKDCKVISKKKFLDTYKDQFE